MNAEIGTPAGSSHFGSIVGHWTGRGGEAGVRRARPRWPASGVQSFPCQSMPCAGAGPIPSHQTSPSSVRTTLVKIVLALIDSIAIGFES